MASRASLDPTAGHVLLAGRRTPVRAAGEGGRVQLGDADGPVLRPPTFGERSRLVAAALGSPGAATTLAASLVATLCERTGPCDARVQQAVALLLAGAGEDGPPLIEAAALVARATASSLPAVELLEATQVDFYARALAGGDDDTDDGWHRVVLAPARGDEETDAEMAASDALVVIELAESLLARGRARGSAALRQAALHGDVAPRDAEPTSQPPAARGLPSERRFAEPPSTPSPPSSSPTADHAASWSPPPADAAPPVGPARASTGGGPLLPMVWGDVDVAPADLPVEPIMRFRQAAPASSMLARSMADTPVTATAPSSPLPSHATVSGALAHGTTPRLDSGHGDRREWAPTPWRLSARETSAMRSLAHDVLPVARVAPTATPFERAAPAPSAAAHPHALSPSPGLPPDDLADRVAESLRREAARRGLVT